MKYLEKSFTVAMGGKRSELEKTLADLSYDKRRELAKRSHEFQGANICLLCGLDAKAKIHEPQLV